MNHKTKINFIAAILLIIMVVLGFLSMKEESAIMDEVAHIPAGYSYLIKKDMRLNPEHPPLIKDLAAIPLYFIDKINFPEQIPAWQTKVNGQWDFGFNFLYKSNNDADKIIFWSRIPMLLILLILGLYIFKWTKELFGPSSALFALFLYTFSPTFIAHGRYVTTDVGAAAGFFIATYYFVKFLQSPSKKNLFLAGIFFGIAQIIKFSLFLLIFYFAVLIIIKTILLQKKLVFSKKALIQFGSFLKNFLLIIIIGYLIIVYPLYLFHISGYPQEKQVFDTNYISSHFPLKIINQPLVWMAKQPVLRPYAQYLLGLCMVFQRATGGNTTFFLGEVTNKGWHKYFPIVYLIKTPLVLHIFTIIALIFIAWQIKKPFWIRPVKRMFVWSKNHFPELAMLIFLMVYWGASISSNLNIGVRHILPAFPFTYVLITGQIKNIFRRIKKEKVKMIASSVFGILLIWYAFSSLSIFPYYLTYFNELTGGAKNGYIYVTDSNLDWGQDLKRLTKWIEKNNIQRIKLDYFGGGLPEYYLKEKYEPWWGERNPNEAKKSWLAVSATFLQQGRAIPVKGWSQPTDYYLWLYQYEPKTVIGNSIFVYYID